MRLAENTGCKKSPFWHHRTSLSACIFAAKACIDNRLVDWSLLSLSWSVTGHCGWFTGQRCHCHGQWLVSVVGSLVSAVTVMVSDWSVWLVHWSALSLSWSVSG